MGRGTHILGLCDLARSFTRVFTWLYSGLRNKSCIDWCAYQRIDETNRLEPAPPSHRASSTTSRCCICGHLLFAPNTTSRLELSCPERGLRPQEAAAAPEEVFTRQPGPRFPLRKSAESSPLGGNHSERPDRWTTESPRQAMPSSLSLFPTSEHAPLGWRGRSNSWLAHT